MDEIQQSIDAGATAPRVTPADLEAEIASQWFFTAAEGVAGAAWVDNHSVYAAGPFDAPAYPETLSLLTFCVLVLKNGIKVTGESACVSAANFNAETGRKIARANAIEKLWPLLGFRLADKRTPAPVHVAYDPQWSQEELAEALRPGQIIGPADTAQD